MSDLKKRESNKTINTKIAKQNHEGKGMPAKRKQIQEHQNQVEFKVIGKKGTRRNISLQHKLKPTQKIDPL